MAFTLDTEVDLVPSPGKQHRAFSSIDLDPGPGVGFKRTYDGAEVPESKCRPFELDTSLTERAFRKQRRSALQSG